jgi:hypothetical protein
MSGVNLVNDVVAFVIEILLLFALGYIGFQKAPGPLWARVAMAVVLPLVMALLWGVFAAPKSRTRLTMPWLLGFKIAAFSAGTWAFYAAGQPMWALAFGAIAAAHLGVATATGRV